MRLTLPYKSAMLLVNCPMKARMYEKEKGAYYGLYIQV